MVLIENTFVKNEIYSLHNLCYHERLDTRLPVVANETSIFSFPHNSTCIMSVIVPVQYLVWIYSLLVLLVFNVSYSKSLNKLPQPS